MTHYLSEAHASELAASGLPQAIIERRGYVTADTDRAAAEMSASDEYAFTLTKNQMRAGLILPCFMDGGEVRAMVKPDSPDMDADGKARKYISPSGLAFDGNGQVYDFGPGDLPPSEQTPRVFFTEGIKKGDALRAVYADDVIIALQSPTALLSTRSKLIRAGIFVALDRYADAEVYLCFDSDMSSNPDVWQGVDRMRMKLAERFSKVLICDLPPDGEGKNGIDDILASKGAEAVKSLIVLAGEKMPPTPKRDGRRRAKSGEQKDAEGWLADYRAYLDEQRAMTSDAGTATMWREHNGDRLLFDTATGFPYRLDAADKVYRRVRADVPAGEVGEWIERLVASGKIALSPSKDILKLGDYGLAAYRKALTARTALTDRLQGHQKAKNTAVKLAAHARLNTDEFCSSEYDHLFPLTGGMSIDFSQSPGADASTPHGCPLVPTPSEARFTWCSPVTADAYAAAANVDCVSEVYDAFIDAISDGDLNKSIALLGFMGYALHGFRKQRFFVLHGDGRNGKGVYLRVLAHLLGAAAHHASPRAFVGEDRRHDAHWLEHRNRRLVACADPAGYTNDSRLLPYSGGDEMTGEVKGGDVLTFTPTAALILHGQADRIKFRIADIAMSERLHAVRLTRRFNADEQDSTLDRRLLADAAQILVQLTHEAHFYHEAISGLHPSEDFRGECTWREGRDELLQDANSVRRFLDNTDVYVVLDSAGEQSDVTVPNFIAHYSRWCEQYGETPITNAGGAMVKALMATYPHVQQRRASDELAESKDRRRTYLDGIYFARSTADADKNADGILQERATWTTSDSDKSAA